MGELQSSRGEEHVGRRVVTSLLVLVLVAVVSGGALAWMLVQVVDALLG